MLEKIWKFSALPFNITGGVQIRFQFIDRLNSGNKNRHNFFIQANFKYLNIGSDSVDHDESGDTKVFVQFRGNSILKSSLQF